MRSRSAPSRLTADQPLCSAIGAEQRAERRVLAEVVDALTATTAAQTSTIVAGEPGWRRLMPLVRLLAVLAAAETIGECFNQNTPASEEPTR
jgi:hypothetical protein